MRTRQLFLGIFALALLLPLLLLACGGSDEPTDRPASGQATAEPTDLPDSQSATAEPTDLPDSEQATSQPAVRTSTDQTTTAPTARPTTQSDTPAATEAPGRAATPAGPTVTEAPQPTVPASPTSTPIVQGEPLGEWILDPENPLLLAAMTGSPADVAKLLPDYQIQSMVTTMTNRADSKQTYTGGERNIYKNVSPLHLAAGFNKDPGMITLLLDAGARIEGDRRRLGLFYTPLHFAALYNEEPAVTAALLEGGADANASTTDKDRKLQLTFSVIELALHYTASPKVVELLLDWGAAIGRARHSPVALAARYNPNIDVLRALLDRFAVGEQKDMFLAFALEGAAQGSPDPEFVKLVLDRGADPNHPTRMATAIRAAINENPNPEVLAALIAGGAETTWMSDGRSLLFNAVTRENPAFAEILLDTGLDPNLVDRNGVNAIRKALTGEIVELLVARGVDPDSKPRGGETPLAHAVLLDQTYPERSKTVVTALLEAGADPNALRMDKTPILIWAATFDNVWLVRELLKYDADIDTEDREGNTALHVAAERSHAPTTEILLEAGADRKAVNDQGSTPCQLARVSGSFTGTPLLGQLCRP